MAHGSRKPFASRSVGGIFPKIAGFLNTCSHQKPKFGETLEEVLYGAPLKLAGEDLNGGRRYIDV